MKTAELFKTSFDNFFKNKKETKKVTLFLEEITSKWYHPNKKTHRETSFLNSALLTFFKDINNSKKPKIEYLEELYGNCELIEYVHALHDTMLAYIEYANETGGDDLTEYYNKYYKVRRFLIELSDTEREYEASFKELDVLPRRLVVSTFLKAREMDFEQFRDWWFRPINYSLTK